MKLSISSFATTFVLFFLSSPSLHAVIITDTITSRIINATADEVWPYIENFCDVYLYAPLDVSFCTTGVPNEPGLIRYIVVKGPAPTGENKTIVLWEQHKLTAISPKNRTLELVLLANNRGLVYYNPVQQVLKRGTSSQIKWTYDVDLGDSYTQQTFRSNITVIAGLIVDKIENAIASSSAELACSFDTVLVVVLMMLFLMVADR